MSDEQLIKTPGTFGENGNFLLERELGSGGMGGVYMGRDKMLDRPVAVKVMLKEYGSDEAFVERFKKEAQAVARLIHPNIAQVYSYGISDGMPYISMELVAGGSLDGLMKVHGASIDVTRVMKIGEQVAQALRCAADQGLVHGDVKPENVLLDANGNAKLVDFGLAAMQKNTDEIWGTPYYIAPEKVKKEPVDYRADMYSLGGTIYHALTGVAPFEGDDATAVVRKRFDGAPLKPSQVRAGLSPQIDFLVMKMLALNPQDRYPSFEALLEDFKKVMTSGLSSTQTVSIPAAESGGRTTTSTGTKKMVFKTKKFKTVSTPREEPAEDADAGEPSAEASPRPAKPGLKRFKTKISNSEDGETSYEDEDQGGVGGKIAMVIGGIVLAVAVVVGGLLGMNWYSKSSKEAESQAKIASGRSQVEKNAAMLMSEMTRFEEEDLSLALTNAAKQVTQLTDAVGQRMSRLYPEAYVKELVPPPSAELLKELNRLQAPAAAEPAAEESAPAAAPAAEAPAAEKPAAAPKRFRPPANDDEADPMSEEGKKYLKEKAEWEAQQKAAAEKPAEPEPAPEPAAAEAEPAAEAAEPALDRPTCLAKVNDIWNNQYAAWAAALRTTAKLKALKQELEELNGRIASISSVDELKSLDEQERSIDGRFKELKASPDVETAIGKFLRTHKSACRKALDDCEGQLRRLDEARQKKEHEAAEKERIAREKAEAEEKLAKCAEEETSLAKRTYDDIVSTGSLRQLDWRDATNKLVKVRIPMVSAAGREAVDLQIRKIQMMAKVQEIFCRSLKGYTFTVKQKNAKTSLKDLTVEDVDERNITLKLKDGKTKRITWITFYRDYHNNFNELQVKFIRKGSISMRDRCEAMLGVALTLQIICSDDEKAVEYAPKVALEAVKMFRSSEFKDLAAKIFPDIDFSVVEAEAAANNL